MMPRKWIAGWVLAAFAASAALAQAAPTITAAEIVEKNAAARGGVEAWRKIQTMAWAGHVESANAPGRDMPFVLEQKRPNSTRFELMADGQKSVRVYDGSGGWKLRPKPPPADPRRCLLGGRVEVRARRAGDRRPADGLRRQGRRHQLRRLRHGREPAGLHRRRAGCPRAASIACGSTPRPSSKSGTSGRCAKSAASSAR